MRISSWRVGLNGSNVVKLEKVGSGNVPCIDGLVPGWSFSAWIFPFPPICSAFFRPMLEKLHQEP
jgi:hypothetical protein